MTPQIEKLLFPDGRYKFFKGYKLDRLIFQAAFFFWIGVTAFLVLQVANVQVSSDLDYFVCGGGDPFYGSFCKNPFYQPATWRNSPTLPVGEYGNPEARGWLGVYTLLTATIFGLSVILNHFIHNERKE